MAIRTHNASRITKTKPSLQASRLQNTYFKSGSVKSKSAKSRGTLQEDQFSGLLARFVLPSTLIFSALSLMLIFVPGLFAIKSSAKAAPTKDSVRIITDYTYTNKAVLEKIK